MTVEPSFDSRELSQLLASTIGEERAREIVLRAVAALRLDRSRLTREQGLSVLERIASEPGLVGITARLAKSRLRAEKLIAASR